jgi:hypothetical protein
MSKKLKVYVWQLDNGEYFRNYSNFPNIYYAGSLEYSTTDVLQAKTWKTKSGAERILNTSKEDELKHLEHCKTTLRLQTNKYYISTANSRIQQVKEQLNVLNQCTVVEVEIDPDEKKKPRVRFVEGTRLHNYKGFSAHNKGHHSSYCRICGMILGGLPYFKIGTSYKNKVNVCPCCILERAQEAEQLLSKLDPEFRKEIESERFLHKM